MPRIPLISIVDDDISFRSSLENLIRSIGLRAQGFSSAEEFLTSSQFYETDCLILDVGMPRMSGPELQRKMVIANAEVQIIFITAHEDADQRTQAIEAGAVAFLSKPFHEEELLSAIDRALKDS
jgi:FixJ family two-component response regulator